MSILSKKHFHNERAAFAYLETVLWPDGPRCPHCGVVDQASKLKGKSTRIGLWKCYACRKQFTCKVGTVFEHGRMPLHKMLQATYLMCSSKKGVSAHQLHRTLEITYKSAWFLAHRIREAMREGKVPDGLGGANKVVEADETFVGGKAKNAHRGAPIPTKEAVFSLVERDGFVSSHHVVSVTAKTLRPILVTHVDRKSYLMTDEARQYRKMGREFTGHGTVNHSIEEYVRGNFWHTNTVESYFSLLKRGLGGVYQHCGQQHLKRYLGEFDFRYNYRVALGVDDNQRTESALAGIVGKRLRKQTKIGQTRPSSVDSKGSMLSRGWRIEWHVGASLRAQLSKSQRLQLLSIRLLISTRASTKPTTRLNGFSPAPAMI